MLWAPYSSTASLLSGGAAGPSLAGVGSFLGGAAQALGAVGGLFGGKKKRGPSWQDMRDMERQMIFTRTKATMDAAQEAGIHPLAALGFNPGSGGAVGQVGSQHEPSALSRAADFGQGVSRAVEAFGSREEREIQRRSALLALENQELQNDRLRSEIRLMHQPGTPPGLPDPRYPTQDMMPLGYGDAAPLLRVGVDAKGNPIRVYNDDLGDNEVLQALTALGFSVPDWIHGNIAKPFFRSRDRFNKKFLDYSRSR